MFHESGLVTPDPDGTLGSGGELMAFQVELFCGTETGGFMPVVHTV